MRKLTIWCDRCGGELENDDLLQYITVRHEDHEAELIDGTDGEFCPSCAKEMLDHITTLLKTKKENVVQ